MKCGRGARSQGFQKEVTLVAQFLNFDRVAVNCDCVAALDRCHEVEKRNTRLSHSFAKLTNSSLIVAKMYSRSSAIKKCEPLCT
jgi:hypothetical protein